jgi:anhydro-N-acetylmuramic acid kinase
MQHLSSLKPDRKPETQLVIGLMTGTSMDGIDAALVKINFEQEKDFKLPGIPALNVECLSADLYPFPSEVKDVLNKVITDGDIPLKDLCSLNFIIGGLLADAALSICDQCNLDIADISLIGSHGQTIYHLPSDEIFCGYPVRSTLQIGEPSVIAQKTGITTVADFRPADIAAGGQGAPLVCFADAIFFADTGKTMLVQNIGGISNVTVLGRDNRYFAFDNGPGNSLIDLLVRKYFDKDYDIDGEIASAGHIDEHWIDRILADEPYFRVQPPKSTGRELFNLNFIEKYINNYPLNSAECTIASVTALTARVIAQSYRDFILPYYLPDAVIIGGGGAYNLFLLDCLNRYLDRSIPVKTHEDFGISNKFKEAISFAILAFVSYHGLPGNIPECTGANRPVVLGKFIPGWRSQNFNKASF